MIRGAIMANINDVANEAGVSITTVSRYLNNSYPVSENSKRAIQKAIKKLNYKPNAIARGLINKKTNTVGIVVPSITKMFFPEVVKGIADQCKGKGYSIILANSESNPKEEKKMVENFLERQVDGIVIIDPKIESIPSDYYRKINDTLPLLIVNKYFLDDEITFVYNDENNGAYKATEYLIELGHRKILFLCGPPKSYPSRMKIAGFNRALKDKGEILNCNIEGNYIALNDYTSENTYKYIKENMNDIKRYSALFCASDLMAFGVIKALKSEGYEVPRDFSVMGFDDISFSSLYEPSVTTMSQKIYRLGEISGNVMIRLIQKEEVARVQVLDTELVIRDSCMKLKE
jgi:Transcriptional regulators